MTSSEYWTLWHMCEGVQPSRNVRRRLVREGLLVQTERGIMVPFTTIVEMVHLAPRSPWSPPKGTPQADPSIGGLTSAALSAAMSDPRALGPAGAVRRPGVGAITLVAAVAAIGGLRK